MHCICALKAMCVDYIVEYDSKPDSMVARHKRTTISAFYRYVRVSRDLELVP